MEGIRSIADLKGKSVGVQALGSTQHVLLTVMAAHVGLDPIKDIHWVTDPSVKPIELFVQGKIDAFLGFPPEPQDLRARQIGHVIVNTAVDRPWSQYFCCMLAGNRGIRPQTSGRDEARAARHSEGRRSLRHRPGRRRTHESSMAGFTPRYDYALQTLSEMPYDRWREYDPEDTIRFYALRLHEVGFDQVEPAEDHRRRHRLALPERAQARAEGVSQARCPPCRVGADGVPSADAADTRPMAASNCR